METRQILEQSIIVNNVLKLPNIQLDRKDYSNIKKSLELIGGKWKGGKIQGFIFNSDPTPLVDRLLGNDNPMNLKKDYQYFATPEVIADKLVKYAEINEIHKILEPSAGQGAIVKSILKNGVNVVDCFELMITNQFILKEIKGVNLIGDDFLKSNDEPLYDRIIANPPFSKNQDIVHIQKMYNVLKEGGILVTIASKHWQGSNNKKETKFRNWLSDLNAEIINIEKGVFNESGTNIETVVIKIRKI